VNFILIWGRRKGTGQERGQVARSDYLESGEREKTRGKGYIVHLGKREEQGGTGRGGEIWGG